MILKNRFGFKITVTLLLALPAAGCNVVLGIEDASLRADDAEGPGEGGDEPGAGDEQGAPPPDELALACEASGEGADVVSCADPSQCEGGTVTCPDDDVPCEIQCTNEGSCRGAQIVCPANADCRLICEGNEACREA